MHTLVSTAALAAALLAAPALAAEDNPTIIVTGQHAEQAGPPSPATHIAITSEAIAEKINAISVEDTLKYAPSLVIRKRHIGDNFAPLATRTSGLGASARSLIYADGALLSALIANNNGNGSPRWTLVTPEEIDHIDVLYGPFSAAYAGNSIGAVVNITTREPQKLEARATVLTNLQTYDLYGTHRSLPTWQYSGSVGDKIGALSLLASATRTTANSQPISFITGTSGGYGDVSKTGVPIRIIGAGGLEHHVQDTVKIKAGLDLTPTIHARYVLGIWRDDTRGDVESYIGATPTSFNSGVYTRDALHVSHALSLTGAGDAINWHITATRYRYDHDRQNTPSPDATSGTSSTGFIATANPLPSAYAGGVGTSTRQDGTGWDTFEARLSAKTAAGTISAGAHADHEILNAATNTITNWLDSTSALGQTRSASHGNTRTLALWAQDEIRLAPALKLTLGGRQEWWRAYGGFNTTLNATVNKTIAQDERSFAAFSPKASVEYTIAPALTARLSAGQAFRMPTVGELYQTVTSGVLLTNPNPNLLPERARSVELALEHKARRGQIRVSLLNEVIQNALISQTGPVVGGAATSYVQNVDRTRARVVEIAGERRGLPGGIDVQGSVTYADAITSKDTIFPAAQGKQLPSVPRLKASAVITWHATRQISLTSAARYASRHYANLDNSDTVGNTYTGFYRYFVIDLRAQFRVSDRFDFALGVDNVNNDKYFLYHPFPQRSFTAQVNWKL